VVGGDGGGERVGQLANLVDQVIKDALGLVAAAGDSEL
jgi:hypothetical protein